MIDVQDLSPKLRLMLEIQHFFYEEADLLDERKFSDWLNLFTDDVRYWMPLVRNFQHGHPEQEYSREREESAWMDEDKTTMRQRVEQLATGIHWAEEPISRMSHLITNVRILEARPDMSRPSEVLTKSRILVYRNRLQDEVDIIVAKRKDTLRREDGTWRIARREIFIDQNVLLAKNLTTFF